MPLEDAHRWNQRYRATPAAHWQARSFLRDHLHMLPAHGRALDVAMGMGQNAALLLERGLEVVGVDIAWEAVFAAKRRFPRLMALVGDLEQITFPDASFDVILNFCFLSRPLCAQFARLLKPGGVLVFETLTQEMTAIRPDISPQYLLAPGEARQLFAGWEIMVYKEGWTRSDHDRQKAIASLIARLPENGLSKQREVWPKTR